jgi:hypothetical protein
MAVMFGDIHRRVQRAPVNPLDVSTVVSIYPVDLDERKPTISPGRFILPKGSYTKPSILKVISSSWWRELDENQPLLEIPVSSVQVADSIIRDYSVGIFMCDMGEKRPGLFFIPGEFSVIDVMTKHKQLLELAHQRQTNWFHELVNAADILWARTNGNPLAIMDVMRLAARELGIKDKPWMSNFIASQVVLDNCPACGSLVNKQYPVCNTCKTVIDKEKFEKLGLKFAQ